MTLFFFSGYHTTDALMAFWKNGNVNDGMAAAEYLVGALMFSSGKWYMSDPTVEVMFKDPAKGLLTRYKSYEVVNREGWLLVRKSSRLLPDWSAAPLLRTKSPKEAVQAMRQHSQGHVVKVGVECKDNDSGNQGGTCRDATFWDIKFESRPAAANNKGSPAAAAAAAAAGKMNRR